MKVWVAYSEPEYEGDFGAKAVGASKEAAVEGLRRAFKNNDVDFGPIENDSIYDCVDMYINEHKVPGFRAGSIKQFYLLEFEVTE